MLIQKTLIDKYEPHMRDPIWSALKTLSHSGIWQDHIRLEQEKMMNGPENEDPAALAVRILEGRKRVNLLTELQTLGLNTPRDNQS